MRHSIPSPDSPVLDRRSGSVWGSFIGDALAMPVHWYYHRDLLRRDYGEVWDYLPPRNPHPDSILWRSHYTPLNQRGDILRNQACFWGQRNVHYHQFLKAGENTLNLQLAKVLTETLTDEGKYDPEEYANRYIDFLLAPGRHRDTYVEECHRHFFTHYAQGQAPERCGQPDRHIGGLSHVGVLCAWYGPDNLQAARQAVQTHVALTHPEPDLLRAADVLTQLLIAIMGGQTLSQALAERAGDFFSTQRSHDWRAKPDAEVVGSILSPACYVQDAFPASLYLAWKYADDLEAGLIANTNLGGDNCHRGAVIGALLGAARGCSGIPQRFLTGLAHCRWLAQWTSGLPT